MSIEANKTLPEFLNEHESNEGRLRHGVLSSKKTTKASKSMANASKNSIEEPKKVNMSSSGKTSGKTQSSSMNGAMKKTKNGYSKSSSNVSSKKKPLKNPKKLKSKFLSEDYVKNSPYFVGFKSENGDYSG